MKRKKYTTEQFIGILREVDATGNRSEVCQQPWTTRRSRISWAESGEPAGKSRGGESPDGRAPDGPHPRLRAGKIRAAPVRLPV